MKKFGLLALLLILALTACQPAPPPETPAPTDPPVPQTGIEHLLISEVLAGAEGNNLYDFIELYNPTAAVIDLKGYALWYLLKDGDDETLVHVWDQTALVPPFGHYLLGQQGEDFQIEADLRINQPLLPQRGGLILKGPDRAVVDSLGWGNAPSLTVEGQAAPAMENDISLERAPGAGEGNFTDTDNNAGDFTLNSSPSPENSGSGTAPFIENQPTFTIAPPNSVSPGASMDYQLLIENRTSQTLTNLTAVLPIPEGFSISAAGDRVSLFEQTAVWDISSLEAGQEAATTITVTAPLSYTSITTHSYYVSAENAPIAAFGPPVTTSVEGGSIPVATARELEGQEVVVEGIATMYTGGLYAGSGAKFYLRDETGGVQVYVAGAGETLHVNIGDRVRVQGFITLYRGAIEVVPVSEGLVEVLERKTEDPAPVAVSVRDAAVDGDALKGDLIVVEGTLARAEEFTYSYELDIVDAAGALLTAYLDKETGITLDTVSSGDTYAVTGIMEGLDDNLRLYPRQQSDLEKIYPETILIEARVPVSVTPDEEYQIGFEVFNHMTTNAADLVVSSPVPEGVEVIAIANDGAQTDQVITWTIPTLEGNGASTTVTMTVRPLSGAGSVTVSGATVSASALPEPAAALPTYTFTSGLVPIWAIQGEGERSPFNLQTVRTVGTVTGVFPDLNGFWLQETVSDDDPATSGGLFVFTGGMTIDLSPGDLIEVEGLVRESYQQTQLNATTPAAITFISANTALPAAVPLDPPSEPAASQRYFESLEGMLVTLSEPAVAVAPTSRYGEFAFVLSSQNVDRLYRGDETGLIIMADDGTSFTHDDQSTMQAVVAVGDTIANLTGPLAFTYSNYKIEPLAPPTITPVVTSLPAIAPLTEDQFSIMTWNIENLFDIVDPHPSSPPLPTVSEYRLRLDKIAATFIATGLPTIIGVQEVENIGILEDIAEHELLRPYGYIPILIEGTDSRGIDVGYLVRGDRADVLATEQFPAPEGITSRPPLLAKVQLKESGKIIYLLNNHFTSMSGGEAATEPRRNAQSVWNVTVMQEQILADDPDALVAVLGDLNSYLDALPIDTLRDAGLIHTFDHLTDTPYTYIYEGVSQVLDHILVTPSLDEMLSEVIVLHFNADYPLSAPDDPSPSHTSDHDPVLVIFNVE